MSKTSESCSVAQDPALPKWNIRKGALRSQFCKRRLDPRENGSFTELGKDAPCFSQMLDGKGTFSPTFIKKAKDHFCATDMMTIGVKLRVASNLGN